MERSVVCTGAVIRQFLPNSSEKVLQWALLTKSVIWAVLFEYTNSLVNATFNSRRILCYLNFVLTKIGVT